MPPTILLLAPTDDGEAHSVADVLKRRGGSALAWLDLSWFPKQVAVEAELGPTGWRGQITTPEEKIALDDITAIYSHHSQPFVFPEGLSDPEHRFATVEARFGLGGILSSLQTRWVSHPSAVADAEYKPVQLAAAVRCGLHIPATWMGNSPAHARAFISGQLHGAVSKAIMHKLLSEQNQIKSIYTTSVEAADVDERVGVTMHQFQNRVRQARDVRALITTTGCEAVEITGRDGRKHLDYRDHYDTLTYTRTTLPRDIIKRSQRLLSELRLNLGVFDFAVTESGETLYYEVNPGGQWAWLEEETRAPMSELVADELCRET